MNYRLLYKRADETKQQKPTYINPAELMQSTNQILSGTPAAVGQPRVFDDSQTRLPDIQPPKQNKMVFPTKEDLANPASAYNEALRQNNEAAAEAENGRRVGEEYNIWDMDQEKLRNMSPYFRKGFFEAQKKKVEGERNISKNVEQGFNYAILADAGLGRGAERMMQLPYNLIYHTTGAISKALDSKNPLDPASSFFTGAINDARQSVVNNGGSGDVADVVEGIAEAIPEMLAYNYAMGKILGPLAQIPGRTAKVMGATLPYTPAAMPIVEEGAKAIANTDTVRYSDPGIRYGRIPAMQQEVLRLTADGIPHEQAVAQVNQRRITDIVSAAQRMFPDDEQKRNEFIKDKIKTFTRLGAPGWLAYDLTRIGVTPEEALRVSAEGASAEKTNKEMEKSTWGKIPGATTVVNLVRSADSQGLGAALAGSEGYMKAVDPAVNGIYSMLSDDNAKPVSSTDKKFMKGYMSTIFQDQEKKEAFLSKVSSGLASKYDLDSMKPLLAKIQKMGKDMNWEEYGLTAEQGAELMQAMETGFKNRACELWKQDILGNTPKLVSLWLRNMGVSDAIADVVENPWAFYTGAFGLLVGGGALVGGLIGGGDSDAPQRVVRSPYDEGYTQFARTRL